MKELLDTMLESGIQYGTILRHADNLMVYWSPLQWHSPQDGYQAQHDKWIALGAEGWYPNGMKERFFALRTLAGSYPGYPGEYDMRCGWWCIDAREISVDGVIIRPDEGQSFWGNDEMIALFQDGCVKSWLRHNV